MAGKRQHFLPQFLQRGFLAEKKRKLELAYCYRSDGSVFKSDIENIGVSTYFYSDLSKDSTPTLDDEITDYELVIVDHLNGLRHLLATDKVDAEKVGIVLGHLTLRNAHIRSSFTSAAEAMGEAIAEAFSDPEKIIQIFGFENDYPSELMIESFGRILDHHPHAQRLTIPRELFARMAFLIARENRDEMDFSDVEEIQKLCRHFTDNAGSVLQGAHQQALSEAMTADAWAKRYAKLHWRKVELEDSVVLPDCVAIAEMDDGSFLPAVHADEEEVRRLLFPISSHSVLIGDTALDETFYPEVGKINAAFASCSDDFFVSDVRNASLERLCESIGARSAITLHNVIDESIAEFPTRLSAPAKVHPEIPEGGNKEDFVQLSPKGEIQEDADVQIPISLFPGLTDEAVAIVVEALTDLIQRIAEQLPVRRISGITFSNNYEGAVQDAVGTRKNEPPQTQQEGNGFVGVIRSVIGFHDEVAYYHIIGRDTLCTLLISPEQEDQSLAQYMIGINIASAGVFCVIDEAMPGLLTKSSGSHSVDWLFGRVYSSLELYLAARNCAWIEHNHHQTLEQALTAALLNLNDEMPKCRLEYRFHEDLDRLLGEASDLVGEVLRRAAELIGNRPNPDDHTFACEELDQALKDAGLRKWADDFKDHLSNFWSKFNASWGRADLFAFNRHTERLLWQYGVFMFDTEQGECYVEIPMHTDAAELSSYTKN